MAQAVLGVRVPSPFGVLRSVWNSSVWVPDRFFICFLSGLNPYICNGLGSDELHHRVQK